MTTTNKENSVWLIIGASSGIGKNMAVELLKKGYKVAATARNVEKLADLQETFPKQLLKLTLDVTNKQQITNTIQEIVAYFGKIDVLFNNAGFAYASGMEEAEETVVREMFETNVFGVIRMINAVLPTMRRQREGVIFNLSSIGGLMTFDNVGFYNATKFAVEAIGQQYREEVAHLGIHITNIEPSGFRTNFTGGSLRVNSYELPDYQQLHENKKQLLAVHNKELGNPNLLAKAVIKLYETNEFPLHLLAGSESYQLALMKTRTDAAEFEKYKDLTINLDFGKEKYWES